MSTAPTMSIANHLLQGERVSLHKSPNHGGQLEPDTIVIHATMSPDADSAIKALTDPNQKASAHLVIARDGGVTQLLPFNVVAWHAGRSAYEGRTGFNNFAIGIELENAGWLTKKGTTYHAWFEKTYNESEVVEARHRNPQIEYKYWHRYTDEQIKLVEEISALLIREYQISSILGHEEIAPGRKQDPGPAFPLDSLRARLIPGKHKGEEQKGVEDAQSDESEDLKPPFVYLSYHEGDKHWMARVRHHFEPFLKQNLVRSSTEPTLTRGHGDKVVQIQSESDRWSACLFLITSTYLQSKAVREEEFLNILRKQGGDQQLLLPIILEPAPWQEVPWLAKLRPFPEDGQAIATMDKKEADRLLSEFATKVVEAVTNRSTPDSPAKAELKETVPTHNDSPAEIDELGRRPFAEVIATRIHEVWHKSPCAFAVHLHGPWGSGKSSLLNFMRRHMVSGVLGEKWVVVDFNAWRNQHTNPPWWPLIREVYSEAVHQVGQAGSWQAFKLRLRWFVWRLRADWLPVVIALVVIVGMSLLVTGSLNVLGESPTSGDRGKQIEFGLKVIAALLAVWAGLVAASRSLLFGSARAAKTYMDLSSDPLRPIASLFKKLVNEIDRPLAIFIDDLDRCTGDYVVDLLEGIQTLFRDSNAAYVVAADRDWVRMSFEKRYEDYAGTIGEPGRPLGYLFLEKIFQVSASVPLLSAIAMREYWARLLETAGSSSPEDIERVQQEAEKEAEKIIGQAQTDDELKQVVSEYEGDAIIKQGLRAVAAKRMTTAKAREHLEHKLKPFSVLLEPNPRAMKRLINAFSLRQAVNFLEERDVETGPLVLWTILELRWPLLTAHLVDHPETIDHIRNRTLPQNSVASRQVRQLIESQAVREVVTGKNTGAETFLDQKTIRRIFGQQEVAIL
ncbi:MAG: P-loop NTPase fold protein [bacterium]